MKIRFIGKRVLSVILAVALLASSMVASLTVFAADDLWNGSVATPTAIDEDGSILIKSAEELAYVIKNGGGNKYKLACDIYLNDITKVN